MEYSADEKNKQTTDDNNTIDEKQISRVKHPRIFSPTWFRTPARHPTLHDVLNRQTTAPIDLFSFYIYMRDQQRSVDYLDFWLDVSQHMTLCRHYVRHLRRSVLSDSANPDVPSKRNSDRSGIEVASAYDGASPSEKKLSEQRVSAVLRGEGGMHSHSNSHSSNYSVRSPSVGRRSPAGGRISPAGRISPVSATTPSNQEYLSSSANNETSGTSSGSPETTGDRVKREDIRASAERILYTYLLPGSEREIILPQSIINEITHEIEEKDRDDPEVFDAAKDYVFQAMDRDAFPGFLESKALGNLVPASVMMRLIIGLFALFVGFWAGLTLIFLDKSKATRCWLILPFTLGTYSLITYEWLLDPILAFFGSSEYTFMNFHRIHEYYVRQLLIKRGIMTLVTFLITDLILCLIFILVPGKRL